MRAPARRLEYGSGDAVMRKSLFLLTLGSALGSCAGPAPAPPAPAPGAPSPPTASYPPPAPPRVVRQPLGEPAAQPLEHAVEPIRAGFSLLYVASAAGEPLAFVRRRDAAGLGPVVRLEGELAVGAFDAGSDWLLVTSDGVRRGCVTRYATDAALPKARACADVDAALAVAVGDRVAFLSSAPAAPPNVYEALVRWASPEAGFEAEAQPTGLRFRRPQANMTLIDAKERAGGIDLLHFDARDRATARIAEARLSAEGRLVDGSRATLGEGTTRDGYVTGHLGPRLFATDAGTVYLALEQSRGPCHAVRVAPTVEKLAAEPLLCSLDPAGLIWPAPLADPARAALDRLLAQKPRRLFGQPPVEPELVAWVGKRAYFTIEGVPHSAALDEGAAVPEPAAFPARRARIPFAGFSPSGHGVALVDDALVLVDPGADAGLAIARHPAQGLPAAARIPSEPALDRRAVARIGESWWLARRDVVRVWPDPLVPEALRGRAHPDGAALVGGAGAGFFVELSSDRVRVTKLSAAGEVAPPIVVASPLAPGFAAVERGAGGGLLAGRGEGGRVLALAFDAEGRFSLPAPTSLPVAAGFAALRLSPLPGGGAVLSDLARSHAVWLDDDGREIGAAAWPPGASAAVCDAGLPARTHWPDARPGAFLHLGALEEPASCVLGDALLGADGAVRWLGARSQGLDSIAEVGLERAREPVEPPPARPAAAFRVLPPLGELPCPSDMVAVAGGLCIDRFEPYLVDKATGQPLSPDYPTDPRLLRQTVGEWSVGRARIGDLHARALPLPHVPLAHRGDPLDPMPVSRFGARPTGYVKGHDAATLCAAAGKRVCTIKEWTRACRGELDTLYPYGASFTLGPCNVVRDEHPAIILHQNASIGHLDPRLNRVLAKSYAPLFQTAGASGACVSRWGLDGAYDMVGNQDEWLDDPRGIVGGGFYSREQKKGCEAHMQAHSLHYRDYSMGLRCCKDAAAAP
jgi:hypothetical protein